MLLLTPFIVIVVPVAFEAKKHGHGHVCRVGHGHDTLTRQFSKNAGHDTAGTRQIYIYIYIYIYLYVLYIYIIIKGN